MKKKYHFHKKGHNSDDFTLPEIVTPKVKKRIGKTILILLIIFLVISSAVFVLGIKIRFILGEELKVDISTNKDYYLAKSGESIDVSFTIANENFFKCQSQCNYELVDLDKNKIVSSEDFTLQHNQDFTKTIPIASKNLGNKLFIYSLNVNCRNLKSLVCLTEEEKKHNSKLFFVETELTAEEQSLSLEIKDKLKSESEKVNTLKTKYFELEDLLTKINPLSTEMQSEKKRLSDFKEKINSTELNIQKQVQYWQESKFSLFLPSSELDTHLLSLTTLGKRIRGLAFIRNETITVLKQVESDSSNIKKAYYHSPLIASEIEKLEVTHDLLISGNNFSEEKINLQTKKSQEIIGKLVEDFNLQASSLIEFYSPFANVFVSENDCFALNLIQQQLIEENVSVNTKKLDHFINKSCSLEDINVSLLSVKIEDVDFVPMEKFFDPLNLGNQTKQCCMFGECKPFYGFENEGSFTLFIHGHALNKANTPEASMAAFAKLQEELQEFGFINAAEINYDAIDENLNKCTFPITARSTYYYIPHFDLGKYSLTVQKSERIENYALRLREILNEVKDKFPQHKINIVAHSMGGLVVREYLDLFGTESVSKVVFINSPHHGVTGKVDKFCSVIGASKECEDLSAGSVFLKRINGKSLPAGIDYYNIRSNGCLMEGVDGDGVVTMESAYLEGAEDIIIKGQCTDALQSNLHSDVLDPSLYPEIVDILKDIFS